jgi:hypothetical protein
VEHAANAQWIGGPSVLIFDVNETLLDLESMHPLFSARSDVAAGICA